MEIVPVKKLDRIDEFLRSFTSYNTRIAYEKDLKDYATFSSPEDPISFAALVRYRDHLIANAAPSTVMRKFAAVKSFLSFLANQGAIFANPAINLKVPKARTIEPTEAFDDREVNEVINQADVTEFEGNTHRMAMILMFHLGVRRSELVRLKLKDFSEHRGHKFVTVLGKGSKVRLIPLTELVSAEVKDYLFRYEAITGEIIAPSDFLLKSRISVSRYTPLNPSTVYRMIKRYSKSAGVSKRVSPHSCRATLISHLLEKDVSPRSVADIAGHASINTTVGTYDKKRDAITNSAVSKIKYE